MSNNPENMSCTINVTITPISVYDKNTLEEIVQTVENNGYEIIDFRVPKLGESFVFLSNVPDIAEASYTWENHVNNVRFIVRKRFNGTNGKISDIFKLENAGKCYEIFCYDKVYKTIITHTGDGVIIIMLDNGGFFADFHSALGEIEYKEIKNPFKND